MSYSCQYRSVEPTGRHDCVSCKGHVQVKSFRCLNAAVIEDECVETKSIAGLATCRKCEHRLMFPALSREEKRRQHAIDLKAEPTGLLPVSLVITTSGNRAELLKQCLDSVFAEDVRPEEVIVIDDNSPDDTEQVVSRYEAIYHRGEFGCAGASKRFGVLQATREYVCVIDGDDMVSRGFFAALYSAMANPHYGLVYPQARCFGDKDEVLGHAFDPAALDRYNYICNAGLWRRDALRQIGGWAVTPQHVPDDYTTVREVLACGWLAQFVPRAVLKYRRHAESVSSYRDREIQAGRHHWADSYPYRGLVTVVALLAGREWCLSEFLMSMLDCSGCDLVLVDNSRSEGFAQRVLAWLSRYGLRFRSVAYRCDDTLFQGDADDREYRQNNADAVNDHVAGLWARHTRDIRTPLVYLREDDVIPPGGTLGALLERMEGTTAGIGAIYETRSGHGYCAWKDKHLIERPDGMVRVDGISFGALLVRRQILQRSPLRSRGEGEQRWYDWQIWRPEDRVYAADIVCDHLMNTPEGYHARSHHGAAQLA